jgi:glycerol-3-phosphate dehydrogenase (NAD(P)+)
MSGQAAATVMSMEDEIIVRRLQTLFHSGLFRVYTNTDLIGCELGGVLKNIIAIAVGMGDGLGAGDNTRSALITRGLSEMTRLGVAMGGRAETFAGLTGMGDLIATCTSTLSRNRHVGVELGKGRRLDDIIASMHMVAEGVKSAPTVMALAERHNVSMPISRDVFDVLQGNKSPSEIFRGLLRSAVGSESDAG